VLSRALVFLGALALALALGFGLGWWRCSAGHAVAETRAELRASESLRVEEHNDAVSQITSLDQSPRQSWCAALVCLQLAVTLCACSSLSTTSKPPQPLPPLPRPAALIHDSPGLPSYSERARASLKKSSDMLSSFETSATPLPPPVPTETTP